jgi:hypothetical protein
VFWPIWAKGADVGEVFGPDGEDGLFSFPALVALGAEGGV